MIDQAVTSAPVIRTITVQDLFEVLSKGVADFYAKPSHVVFLSVMWPIIGVVLWIVLIDEQRWPLLFPLAAGFSLVGPSAALIFYEMSRRREIGIDFSWIKVITGIQFEALVTILGLTVVLLGIFVLWLLSAQVIYNNTLGPDLPGSIFLLLEQVFTTSEGMTLLIAGNLAGGFFAVLVLMMSAVSFPMVLDRRVSAITAMGTSARAVMKNPVTMLVWGAIIAGSLLVGFVFLLVGLAIVLPVLGHATWHLYRKVVEHG